MLTTQYLEEADRLADEIVVLSGGSTVAAGTPAELKARVGERRVHVSLPDARSPRPRGCSSASTRSSTSAPARLSIAAPDGPARPAGDARRAGGAGIAVEEASLSQPTLDDAFFALAGTEPTAA